MGYIYKITNDINDKIYIGKTIRSQKRRMYEHCYDSMHKPIKNKPLHAAMKKYGCEHFDIHLIEECPIENLFDREIYWIEFYHSYGNGYNATKGGDGTIYCDYQKIKELFDSGMNGKEISELLGYDHANCCSILKSMGVSQEQLLHGCNSNRRKPVLQFTVNTNELVCEYESLRAAAIAMGGKNKDYCISRVCQKKQKTAFGYRWEYKI